MTVYCPECWICKHAITVNGLKEGDVIFAGCEQNNKKESCKFEGAEFRATTSLERSKNGTDNPRGNA